MILDSGLLFWATLYMYVYIICVHYQFNTDKSAKILHIG